MWSPTSFLVLLLALQLYTCDGSSTTRDQFPSAQLSTVSDSSVSTDKVYSTELARGKRIAASDSLCMQNRTLAVYDPWSMYDRVLNMSLESVQAQSKIWLEHGIDGVERVLICKKEDKEKLETELVDIESSEKKAQNDYEEAVKIAKEIEERPDPLSGLRAEFAEKKARLDDTQKSLETAERMIREFLTDQVDKREHIIGLLKNEPILADAINNISSYIETMQPEKENLTNTLEWTRSIISSGEERIANGVLCPAADSPACATTKEFVAQKKLEEPSLSAALGKIEDEIARATSSRSSLDRTWYPLRQHRPYFHEFLEATDNHTAAAAAMEEVEERVRLAPERLDARPKEEAAAAVSLRFLKGVIEIANSLGTSHQEQLLQLQKEIFSMEEKLEAMRKELERLRSVKEPVDVYGAYIKPALLAFFSIALLIGIYLIYKTSKEALNERMRMRNARPISHGTTTAKIEKEVASRSSLSSKAVADNSSKNDDHRDSPSIYSSK